MYTLISWRLPTRAERMAFGSSSQRPTLRKRHTRPVVSMALSLEGRDGQDKGGFGSGLQDVDA